MRGKKKVPSYTPATWAEMKRRNGYALTATEKFLYGGGK